MEKISILVTSGSREKLQMAGMLASVGAVSGSEVLVFLSMNALAPFVKDHADDVPVEGEIGRLLLDKQAPPFLQLFEQAAELGDARIHPCSMAMDILGVGRDELLPFLGAPLGLTKFLSEAQDAQTWSF
ncbi:DsrE/DsrF/DrsH-like family protein [Acidihalobacter prosperus]|uniref:Peroxiredoxin family protein n=1 Tax=Acidihalobacter prosperus TaxID=160660 RepID=A0A1A6C4L4_9GAMM|nr:DsrE/DsrF/DrsH-like family protein [Acidihalobacter prosperus]OBS09494.1 hypothetical protein Thpro_021822 [Acidihalobacter prosperus]